MDADHSGHCPLHSDLCLNNHIINEFGILPRLHYYFKIIACLLNRNYKVAIVIKFRCCATPADFKPVKLI